MQQRPLCVLCVRALPPRRASSNTDARARSRRPIASSNRRRPIASRARVMGVRGAEYARAHAGVSRSARARRRASSCAVVRACERLSSGITTSRDIPSDLGSRDRIGSALDLVRTCGVRASRARIVARIVVCGYSGARVVEYGVWFTKNTKNATRAR